MSFSGTKPGGLSNGRLLGLIRRAGRQNATGNPRLNELQVPLGPVQMNNQQIIGLNLVPTDPSSATARSYVTEVDNNRKNLTDVKFAQERQITDTARNNAVNLLEQQILTVDTANRQWTSQEITNADTGNRVWTTAQIEDYDTVNRQWTAQQIGIEEARTNALVAQKEEETKTWTQQQINNTALAVTGDITLIQDQLPLLEARILAKENLLDGGNYVWNRRSTIFLGELPANSIDFMAPRVHGTDMWGWITSCVNVAYNGNQQGGGGTVWRQRVFLITVEGHPEGFDIIPFFTQECNDLNNINEFARRHDRVRQPKIIPFITPGNGQNWLSAGNYSTNYKTEFLVLMQVGDGPEMEHTLYMDWRIAIRH